MIENNDSARRHCPRHSVSRSCQLPPDCHSRSVYRIVSTSARNSCSRLSPALSLSSGAMAAYVVVNDALRVACYVRESARKSE